MQKIYHYIYYRIYVGISKRNNNHSQLNSAALFSMCVFLNVFTIFFFLKKYLSASGYIFFLISASVLSFINFMYFDDYNHKIIMWELKNFKIKELWKYLIDAYPLISFLLISISVSFSWNSIFVILIMFIILRAIDYFIRL